MHEKDESEALSRQRWLIAGSVFGMIVAVTSVARPHLAVEALPDSAVASVNGESIEKDALERAYAMVTADRRAQAEPAEVGRVLDRLIDEELLLQRAVELGLLRSDPSVRSAIVRAMIDSIVLDVDSREADETELRDYFERNRERFARPASMRLESVTLRDRGGADDVSSRARAVVELLRAGAEVGHVRRAHGDAAVAPLPTGALLAGELRAHFGPSAAQELMGAKAGEVVGPLPYDGDGTLAVVRVLSVTEASTASFVASRELVAAAYRNARADDAMRAYLARMRERADIVVREGLREDGAA